MGRWAQRQRTGGAGSTMNYITRLDILGATQMLATYRFPVDATDFTGNEFKSIDNEFVSTGVMNQAITELQIDFADDVDTEQGVTYVGTVPNLISPQAINYH